MMDGTWRSRLKDVVAPALLVVLPLCLFGPYTIFSGNEAEFSAPFWVLIRPLLLAGAGIAARADRHRRRAAAAAVSRLCRAALRARPRALDPGRTSSSPTTARSPAPRSTGPASRGAILMRLRCGLAFRCWPLPRRDTSLVIAPFASAVLVALQAAALIVSVVRADAGEPGKWQGPTDTMFELSRTRNVIHIVLDAFQSDIFGEILAEERPALDRSLSGAVFFANHIGAFPTTIVSIPAMLTGKVYRNDRPLQRYVCDILKEGSIFKSLRASGYRVDAATGMHHGREAATNYVRLRRPYVSYDDYIQFTAWQLADLSLFRHAPHILRPWIFNDESWRLQTVFGPGDTSSRRHHAVNGAVVLGEFARRLTPSTDEPVYKYIHVGIPHRPVTVNGKCEFIGVVRATRPNYKEQARCAVKRVTEILDRLKELGVYDSTFVVISSDHGIGMPSPQFANDRETPMGAVARVAGNAMALLVVKPLNSSGPVRISQAPTTITDIPATILDGVGLTQSMPGEPALKLPEDARRVRPWAYYDWERDDWGQNYFPSLDIVDIDGRVLDGNNWTLLNTIYEPTAGAAARTRGLYEAQTNRAGVDYQWSMPNIFFHVPASTRTFEMKVRSVAPKPQTRHGLCRGSSTRQGRTERSVVGHPQVPRYLLHGFRR